MPLTNSQYDEIMRSYQQRQLQRQHLILARKEEIAGKTSKISEIDAQIASLSVQRARRLLDGDTTSLTDLRDQISALSAKKGEVLTSLGYPKDYFSPPYVCPDCEDTGYIGNRRCHCLTQASIDLVYTQSNLQNILEKENFEQFSFDYYSNDMFEPGSSISSLDAARNTFAKCRQFVQNFDDTFENILLFGDTGVGKTFLSNCIAKELLDTGHSVIYFSAHQFFHILEQNTFGRNPDAALDYRNIFDCDLLIIDDLGTEMVNSFTSSQFFICLNERIRNQKSTLISSNLELMEIASVYSERVFSRISNSFLLLHLFGKDIRIQKKLSGK
jgi:DNA replication protein DnaC